MPLVAIIKPKQSVLFEVSFQPDQANFTYARDLILLASSEACEGDCIEFPLIETLRCIGILQDKFIYYINNSFRLKKLTMIIKDTVFTVTRNTRCYCASCQKESPCHRVFP